MEKSNIIVEMTPFLFEDGEQYFFDIRKRSTNSYHNLFVYKLDIKEIKHEIKHIIVANQAVTKIKDWDGFVGDIPDEAKKALSRDSKLNDLGIK